MQYTAVKSDATQDLQDAAIIQNRELHRTRSGLSLLRSSNPAGVG
jgi:hypothetical protein